MVNELLADTRFWLTTLGAALLMLIRHLWKKQEKRLEDLEAIAVRKDELQKLREDMNQRHQENRNERDRLHKENREALTEIRDSITGTHRRLDEFFLHGRDGS